MKDLLARAAELLESGAVFCLATVIASPDPERLPGTRCLFLPDGSVEPPEGPLSADPEVTAAAERVLSAHRPETVTLGAGTAVFLDLPSSRPELLVCGAGHIAVPLARFAHGVGFAVTVLDDRADFACAERFPGCTVLAEPFVPALRSLPLGVNHYAVVITRGHEYDTNCLAEILTQDEIAYVGLIGSRRRVRFVLDALEKKGVPRDRLDRVFTPIGLPIGAESPEEIALCIAAELVAVRRRGPEATRRLRETRGNLEPRSLAPCPLPLAP